ncbi:MAG TPA: hydrogenase maturation nickel metallochaperone HypA [Spirochaetes bacterium]|nr:hydrogenase maturation nickel metallochaperone HypA [Spirochaetota bacterium]
MHELSIMGSILDIVLEHAGKNGAGRVSKINLEVGELSDLLPEWMQMYFDFVSKDTIAEKAELSIARVPAVLKCRSCGSEFGFKKDDWKFSCPDCDSPEVEIIRGREFKIISIEVD